MFTADPAVGRGEAGGPIFQMRGQAQRGSLLVLGCTARKGLGLRSPSSCDSVLPTTGKYKIIHTFKSVCTHGPVPTLYAGSPSPPREKLPPRRKVTMSFSCSEDSCKGRLPVYTLNHTSQTGDSPSWGHKGKLVGPQTQYGL